ncbi:MAG: hypothetical protein IPM64_05035 [Phycisphaerales bacterium]|nr:hypothetical protein [Phycisphaerales bacterium]
MDFLNSAVPIGRWFDVTVRIHVLFILYAGFRLFGAGAEWRDEAIFITMLFGVVLLHEFGHCFGARSVGGRAHDILLWPLGGLAFAEAPMTPWAQFVTVAAGPLVNVVLAAGTAALLFATTGDFSPRFFIPFSMMWYWPGSDSEWQLYAGMFLRINLLLFWFNMLPVFPMDGGQLLRAILWKPMGLRSATMLSAQVGIVGGAAFIVYGVMNQFFMLIILGLFGASSAWQQYVAARHGHIQEDFGYASRVRGPTLRQRAGGWLGRREAPSGPVNPNPGGWERRAAEQAEFSAEVDRILRKVHEHGIASLSYIERQKLERHSAMLREGEEQERRMRNET